MAIVSCGFDLISKHGWMVMMLGFFSWAQ